MHNFNNIPFQSIERCGHQQLLSKNIFSVSWVLGRFCNYHCSYCWDFGRSDTRDHRPTDLCLKTVDEIKRQARNNGFDSFHFSFTGGEPSLHPGYLEILNYITSDTSVPYHSLHVSTNLSNGLGWLKKFEPIAKKFNDRFITATFHSESAKLEDFLEKCIFLQENEINITIPIVMAPSRFETLIDYATQFSEAGLNVILKPQSTKNASELVPYSQEQIKKMQSAYALNFQKTDYLKNQEEMKTILLTDSNRKNWYLDHSERFNVFEFNRFQGWDCVGGFSNILIREPSGNIMRAHCCQDEPLGHIETGFELYKKVKPCITAKCMGGTDNKIPKRRPGSSLPLWPADRLQENQR